MGFNHLWEGALDMIAPHLCAACDAPVPLGSVGFCEVCEPLLELAPQDGPRSVFLYGGPLADALRRWKYGGRSEIERAFVRPLSERALDLAGEVDAVVPVPLHPRRQQERGFNQSALLARRVAVVLAIPFLPSGLVRVRDTPPQASLDVGARPKNVRAAFRAPRRLPPRVLLIDDVHTTGSTLAECARAAREGGAERVHTMVLARVDS